MMKKFIFSLLIMSSLSSGVYAGGGGSFASGMAGGMMGGLLSGAMAQSSSRRGGDNAMNAVRNLESAVKIDLMNFNSKISNLERRLNDLSNKINELKVQLAK